MTKNILSDEKFNDLEQFINNLPDKKGALIAVLHRAQHLFGYLPQEVQLFIGEKLDIPASKIYGVVSFYSFFNMEPKGDYQINVCLGTACFVRGADKVMEELEKELGIKAGETTADGKFSLDGLRCVGACGLAPVVMVNDKVYGRITKDDVKGIVDEYKNKETE